MTAPVILGILNVTTDSFSDGGRYLDAELAIARATELVAQGANLVDVGGESTRPGAHRIPVELEQFRVLPVVRALAGFGTTVSVDTMNASTARAAAEAGAQAINDVSGGLADPAMYDTVAETGVRYIASHWRRHSDRMQSDTHYGDVVAEVHAALAERVTELLSHGVESRNIILDPGLGFAKTADHNWALLAALPELVGTGYPVLIGASRKRFLARFAPGGAAASERDAATAVISALAADAGVWGVRVHNVASTKTALDVWSAVNGAIGNE